MDSERVVWSAPFFQNGGRVFQNGGRGASRKTIPRRFFVGCLCVAVCTLSITGCGRPKPGTPAHDAAAFVAGVADAAGTPASFNSLFAEGAAPPAAERKKFQQHNYWGKQASVSGDTATVTVEVYDISGTIVGEVEWTAVREGGQWKLKDAPLP